MSKLPLVVVAGPTASGKTRLAIELAKLLDGEIISADSMQIYKYLDIGSAKPSEEERSEAVHHMLDFLEPDDEYSVADYTEKAHTVISDILRRDKTNKFNVGVQWHPEDIDNDSLFLEFINVCKQ